MRPNSYGGAWCASAWSWRMACRDNLGDLGCAFRDPTRALEASVLYRGDCMPRPSAYSRLRSVLPGLGKALLALALAGPGYEGLQNLWRRRQRRNEEHKL